MIEYSPKSLFARIGFVLFLLVFFLLIFQPWTMGLRDLNSGEGLLAAQVLEMDPSMPAAVAHGQLHNDSFPLFPYLVRAVYRSGFFSMAESLRFLSLASLLACSALIFICARHAGSFKSGAVAAAIYFSSCLAIEKGIFGLPCHMTVFFVLSAKMSWFFCGVRLGRWNLAWILSAIFLSAGFYCAGPYSFVFFVFPLLFLRRPLSVVPKLPRWGFALGLAIVAGTILSWALPYLVLGKDVPILTAKIITVSWIGYGTQLLTMPWAFALRIMPWALIAWMPFCPALSPLDETPIFSRYLRTICTVSFVIVWFNPLTNATDFFFIAAPLALLTGRWYEVAARRYSVQMRKLLALSVWGTAVIGAVILLFALLPDPFLPNLISIPPAPFKNDPGYLAGVISVGNLLLMLAFWVQIRRKKAQIWLMLVPFSLGLGAFFWAILCPYRIADTDRSQMGKEIQALLRKDGAAPDKPIYKMGIGGFYAEGFYTGHPLLSIPDADAIPDEIAQVYVISSVFPQDPDRIWRNLLPQDFQYQERRLCLWRGDLVRTRPVKHRLSPGKIHRSKKGKQ